MRSTCFGRPGSTMNRTVNSLSSDAANCCGVKQKHSVFCRYFAVVDGATLGTAWATTGTVALLRILNRASYSLPGCSVMVGVSGVSSNSEPGGTIERNSSATLRPAPTSDAAILEGALLTRMPAASQITS